MPRSTPAEDRAPTLAPAPVRPRRNPRWIAAGLAAMCLGGVGSVALWTQAAGSAQVLQLSHALAAGEKVDADDLVVVTVGRVPAGTTVPASQLSGLVGQEALRDLPAGSLLAPGSLGDSHVRDGLVVVGLRLHHGRIPAQPLPVGAAVTVVAVPGQGQAAAAEKVTATWDARVVTASAGQPDGSLTVDVAVGAEDAAAIARLAATDQVSVVKREGR